jgi:DNA-binding MarR family transcriptional regulator
MSRSRNKYTARCFSVVLTPENARKVESIKKEATKKLRERTRIGHVTKSEVIRHLIRLGLEAMGDDVPDIKAMDIKALNQSEAPPKPLGPVRPPSEPPPDIDLRHLLG